MIEIQADMDRGYLTVRGLKFKGNGTVPDGGPLGEQDGGCMFLYSVDFTAIDCEFDGFRIQDNGGGDGGALFVYNG